MNTSRRRFLRLSLLPVDPKEADQFLYNVTQLQRQRIDELQARVGQLEDVVRWAAKHFGFMNPYRQSDRGEV